MVASQLARQQDIVGVRQAAASGPAHDSRGIGVISHDRRTQIHTTQEEEHHDGREEDASAQHGGGGGGGRGRGAVTAGLVVGKNGGY